MPNIIIPTSPRDWLFDVRRGLVPGHEIVLIRGLHATLPTTEQTIWGGATGDPTFSFSAVTVDIASTSATDAAAQTGALTALVQGLDSSGDRQQEVVTLTGQTEVTTANTYTAINNILVATAGSSNHNVGDLWAGNGTFTAGVPATKYFWTPATYSLGQTPAYTVPTGKQLWPISLIITPSDTAKTVEVKPMLLDDSAGDVEYTIADLGLPASDFVFEPKGNVAAHAADTFFLRGSVSTSTAKVTLILASVLVDV